MKRAMSAEAKAARAKQIMDAAADMLLSTDYRHLKMSSIAKAVGISKGLIFKYFKTKETLFLSLLWREYEKRLDYLEAETEKTDFRDFSDVQELLLSELEHLLYQNPVYIKLESMRSIILEKNADTQLLLKMKEKFYGRVNAWSRKFSGSGIISQGEILDIFFAEIGIITGCYLQNAILNDARNIISQDRDNMPEISETDFRKEILNRMKYYLQGYKQNMDN